MESESKLYLESFREAARNEFSYLFDWGYIMLEPSINKTELVEYWIILFDNKKIDRQVSLSYCPRVALNEQRQVSECIGISVYKSDGVISFEFYLGQQGIDIRPEQFNLDSYTGDVQSKFSKAISFTAAKLKEELYEVLKGTKWLDGMFPDWR